MSRSTRKFQRWIELITFLAGRRYPVPWDQVARGVSGYAGGWASEDETTRASIRRKFERDKKDLRDQGIPLEVVGGVGSAQGTEEEGKPAGTVEGYLLRDGDFFLPYLRLVEKVVASRAGFDPGEPSPEGAPVSERERALLQRLARQAPARSGGPPGTVELAPDEAALALEALRVVEALPGFPLALDARSALVKLRAELGLPDPGSPLLLVERPGAVDLRERLERLATSVLERREVRFRYRGMYTSEVSERRVQPLGLILLWGYWYLVAWDPQREGERQFRVGRMEEVRLARSGGSGAEFEVPGDFRLDRWLARPAWALDTAEGGEGDTVRVHFPHPWFTWAERNGHGEPESAEGGEGVPVDGEGGGTRLFRVRQREPFLRWLLGFEGRARVVDPPDVRDALHEMARVVARAHEGPGGGGG